MYIISILLAVRAVYAGGTTMSVTYSEAYDIKNGNLTGVSCSDGTNGIITKHGWTTFQQIPDFPFIGGASFVEGYNSLHCGECYAVTWQGGKTYMTAIDTAEDGLVMSKQAMDSLTGNQAEFLGNVSAVVESVHPHWCAMPA